MEFKKLGLTDLEVSRIGFGCWAIGGHGYGKVNDRDSIKAIQKALEMGINFFDTADVYGFGHSEEILSKALGSNRDKVVIATKFGVSWDKSGRTYKDCSPKRITEAIEDSLNRLKIECIPLYQIHHYDGRTPIHETMEALKKCQKEGKIRYIGCSNFSPKLVRDAFKTNRIESNQLQYSIIQRGLEADIIECSSKLKMGVITYGVLARGLFSGKYNLKTEFADNDTRIKDENFHGEKLKANLKKVEKLVEISRRYKKTPVQVAIRWTLNNQHITSVLTGVRDQQQIKENIDAISLKLNTEDQATLAMI